MDHGLPFLEADGRRDVLNAYENDPSVYDSAEGDAENRPRRWILRHSISQVAELPVPCTRKILSRQQACHVVVHITVLLFEVGLDMSYWTANRGPAPMDC